MPTVRPAMTSPVSQPTSTERYTLMSAEPRRGRSPLTVASDPAKDREESDDVMEGLLRLNGTDGTMGGD